MTTTNKPAAKLDGSLLLARKGEAMPAVAATQHNNPALAWGAPAHPGDFQPTGDVETEPRHAANPPAAAVVAHPATISQARLRPDSFFAAHGRGTHPVKGRVVRAAQDRDPVALTMRVEDETYLRLKYLAQNTGRSTQQVLGDALERHLSVSGVPQSRKLVVKPE